MKNGVIPLILLALGMMSQAAHAHSEHDKARFVAAGGNDQGRCDNRFRPCKTIAYAAQQASKGDKVLVASGDYPITTQQDLFYLVSEIVPVKGGFSRVDHFQIQNPGMHTTTLTGVPAKYAETLHKQGFLVIADGKRDNKLASLASDAMSLMNSAQSAAPCNEGESAGFACRNLSLLSHVPLKELGQNSTSANDIWGHVDLNTGREYAIIGLRNGVSVVDVTNPESPVVAGSLSGDWTTWRDIKVYQYYHTASREWRAYAYITADNASEGLWIIDLNDLENGISEAGRTNDDSRAHNIYISNVDYSLNIALPGTTPQIHITGSENYGGAWRSYSLKNLQSPGASYLPEGLNRSDYTHDASSLFITDSRATTDCVNGDANGCLVVLDFNEQSMRIWDHTLTDSAKELSSVSYPNVEYTHSGWWTEDGQYAIVHDELDESYAGLNTTVHFFDISSLTSPQLVATWTGDTAAIDHNGFVRGDRYYMSNYEKGLTVLDISDPTAPLEVANFDTFPSSDNTAFNGAWGVYPYLPSGNLIVSDIQGGLYVIKDDSVAMEDNQVSFESDDISTAADGTLNVTVTRTGDGAMSVFYNTLFGSARTNDFTAADGELSWAAGDTDAKTISIPIAANVSSETSESFFLRLFNPQGGSITPGKGLTQITIAGEDNVSSGVVSFTAAERTVLEPNTQLALEVERQGGSSGQLTVKYALRSDTSVVSSDVEENNGELTWNNGEAGVKTIVLTLIDDDEEEAEESFFVDLTASDEGLFGDYASIAITIKDDESNEAPIVNAGNDQTVNATATVTLMGTATDPENNLVNVQWSQTGGDSVTLQNANAVETSFSAPSEAQTLTFSLTAVDEFGVESTDTLTVDVESNETTPVAPPPVNNSSGSGGGSTSIPLLLGLGVLTLMRRKRRG